MTATYRRHGREIGDAQGPMVIEVAPRDVRGASRTDPANCAIARCLKRDPEIVSVSVGKTVVYVETSDGETLRYMLPKDDQRMISIFDEHGYFRPGTYTLLPPPERRRIGARRGERPGSNVRTGRARTVSNAIPERHVGRPA